MVNEAAFQAFANGGVELYFDNSKKFETTSTGVSMPAGTMVVNGPSSTSYTLDVLPLVSTPYGLRVNVDQLVLVMGILY